MSLVGPTFGPETQTYGGYHQRPAAAKPRQIDESIATESFIRSQNAGAQAVSDQVNTLATWIKQVDQSPRDQNQTPSAVEAKPFSGAKVEVNIASNEGATVVNRIHTLDNWNQVADHLEVKDGNVHGFQLVRSNTGDFSGVEYTGTAGFDGLNKRQLDEAAAKTQYAKIFIDLAQIG